MTDNQPTAGWKRRLHDIIFEAETPAGKAFDVVLIVLILLSLLGMMLESVEGIRLEYGRQLRMLDWLITILFTIEYALRIITTGRSARYIFSFYGIVDLLAILPTYVSLFFVGASALSVIRVIRLLRVFRVLKLVQFVGEAYSLNRAIRQSIRKITIFIIFILTVTAVIGTVMFLIEGKEHGFTSIPTSIYWAIVTLTTVGYGDISPQTPLGQILASAIMILGYGVIAVPTGIVSAELVRESNRQSMDESGRPLVTTISCPECSREGHDVDATYCKFCGGNLR